MTENFLQILLYLFQHHVVAGELQQDDRESLVEELDDVGFNPHEARYAIEWLHGFNQAENTIEIVAPAASTSIRAFTNSEMFKLDVRVRGFILFLQQNGLLDNVKRELIIERAMSLTTRQVKLRDLYCIVNVILMNYKPEDKSIKQAHQLLLATTGRKH